EAETQPSRSPSNEGWSCSPNGARGGPGGHRGVGSSHPPPLANLPTSFGDERRNREQALSGPGRDLREQSGPCPIQFPTEYLRFVPRLLLHKTLRAPSYAGRTATAGTPRRSPLG